jgi:alkanesulfonate monooxygenase SsuD/methylene tetrahydromethanopterin reductase-like flavin-dependent oxidoreductase (luciferase family)
MLAIICGDPVHFQPFAELCRRALAEFGKPSQRVGVHCPGHVSATDDEARNRFRPHYNAMHDRIGAQRGWPSMARETFDQGVAAGSLYVGSPETVARKIARTVRLVEPSRFRLKFSAGTLPHATMMDSIGRYGREVVPMVRELIGRVEPVPAAVERRRGSVGRAERIAGGPVWRRWPRLRTSRPGVRTR